VSRVGKKEGRGEKIKVEHTAITGEYVSAQMLSSAPEQVGGVAAHAVSLFPQQEYLPAGHALHEVDIKSAGAGGSAPLIGREPTPGSA
jgi:hypothetical protein